MDRQVDRSRAARTRSRGLRRPPGLHRRTLPVRSPPGERWQGHAPSEVCRTPPRARYRWPMQHETVVEAGDTVLESVLTPVPAATTFEAGVECLGDAVRAGMLPGC